MKNVITALCKRLLPCFGFVFLVSNLLFSQGAQKVIIDSDTANEVDDLFALVQAFINEDWDILMVNACHWQTSHWATATSMEDSHRLNQALLAYFPNRAGTKTYRGAEKRMFDWGYTAHHSPGVYHMIEELKQLPEGEKIKVIALGALTNIASAIEIAPEIISKIELYWLGSTYDFDKEELGFLDFNPIMDVRAFHTVMSSDVEMYVLPINVAAKLQMSYKTMLSDLAPQDLTRFLTERWFDHKDGLRHERAIWDLGLILSMMYPELSSYRKVRLPREYGDHNIHYYFNIEADAFIKLFYSNYNHHFQK